MTPATSAQIPRRGRPGIGSEREAEIIELRNKGKTPAEIVEATGIRKTKVYEVLRVAERVAPVAEPPGPASEETADALDSQDTQGAA